MRNLAQWASAERYSVFPDSAFHHFRGMVECEVIFSIFKGQVWMDLLLGLKGHLGG